jgi:hypothetical protein
MQYVYYVPLPTLQSSVVKMLPSVTHIPILTSKVDFFAWDKAVTLLLCANGIVSHILDPLELINPSHPDHVPILIPILPPSPTQADLADLTHWWNTDNTTQHILTAQIGSIPRGLLPSPNLVTRTALSISQTLTRYYGHSSFADCVDLLNSLHQMTCQPGCVQEFVSKWQTGISPLQFSKFPFSIITLSISQFICGLCLLFLHSISFVQICPLIFLWQMIRIMAHLSLLLRMLWNWTLYFNQQINRLMFHDTLHYLPLLDQLALKIVATVDDKDILFPPVSVLEEAWKVKGICIRKTRGR